MVAWSHIGVELAVAHKLKCWLLRGDLVLPAPRYGYPRIAIIGFHRGSGSVADTTGEFVWSSRHDSTVWSTLRCLPCMGPSGLRSDSESKKKVQTSKYRYSSPSYTPRPHDSDSSLD